MFLKKRIVTLCNCVFESIMHSLQTAFTDYCCNSFLLRFVHDGTILDTDEATWDFGNTLNVKSMFLMCKQFIPKVGKIVPTTRS